MCAYGSPSATSYAPRNDKRVVRKERLQPSISRAIMTASSASSLLVFRSSSSSRQISTRVSVLSGGFCARRFTSLTHAAFSFRVSGKRALPFLRTASADVAIPRCAAKCIFSHSRLSALRGRASVHLAISYSFGEKLVSL